MACIPNTYWAVDHDGEPVGFLLRAKRDHTSARVFFERAIGLHSVAEQITIDKSSANTAALVNMPADKGLTIQMHQSKYMNSIIEPVHQAIKRITHPMLGFTSFRCARILISGIETMHTIRKGQLGDGKDQASSPAKQFYSFAF